MTNPTADGPALHFSVPSRESVAVGNVNAEPRPQVNLPGLAGERNRVGLMSPRPKALGNPGAGDGMLMTGVIVRVMRFHSSLIWSGITGSKFMTYPITLLGPIP